MAGAELAPLPRGLGRAGRKAGLLAGAAGLGLVGTAAGVAAARALSRRRYRDAYEGEDFALLDNQTLTTFLAAVPPETVEIVLKNESESLQEKFFSCMTQRAANQRRFGMDQLGPMSAEKIEEKRREMISLARSMEKRDLIKLTRNTQGQRQS